jgi:hypothetical protein
MAYRNLSMLLALVYCLIQESRADFEKTEGEEIAVIAGGITLFVILAILVYLSPYWLQMSYNLQKTRSGMNVNGTLERLSTEDSPLVGRPKSASKSEGGSYLFGAQA